MAISHPLAITPRFDNRTRALIVDSHVTTRNILASHLRTLGLAQVVQCGRAQEAWKQIEALGFDVILCEHRLADGTLGQDLIEDLRRTALLSLRSVVMVISADASYNTVAEVAESAVDGFVIRPYSPGGLEDRLVAAYRRKEALSRIFDAVEAGRYADALTLCEAMYSRRTPYWTYAARMGAELALRLDKPALASQLFETVLAVKAVPWARLGIARTLAARGEADQAVSTIETLLATEPRYVDAYDVLGKLHAEQGNLQAALKAYQQGSQITPASLQRVQKYGILAYYAGHAEAAQAALERAATLGAQSRDFDPQTLMLLALLHYRQADLPALQACRLKLAEGAALVDIERADDSTPRRLQRFDRTVAALEQTLQGQPAAAAELAAALAAEGGQRDFDIEAATNVLALLAELRAAKVPLADDRAWVRRLGLRFCISRHATEMLVQASQADAEHVAVLRQAHAEIGEMAQAALSQVLAGEPQSAVEQLLLHTESTQNGKLLHSAMATLSRYRERIAAEATLQARCNTLQVAFGLAAEVAASQAPDAALPSGVAGDASMDTTSTVEPAAADPARAEPA